MTLKGGWKFTVSNCLVLIQILNFIIAFIFRICFIYIPSKFCEIIDKPEEPPIKLVLKVGAAEKTPAEAKAKERDVPVDIHKAKEHSSKKKKKKRSSSKDRKKRKHADGVDDQVCFIASHLGGKSLAPNNLSLGGYIFAFLKLHT